ncbi:MAG: hypothetical protein ABI831_10010 [Betaproteobacteria bacterium]
MRTDNSSVRFNRTGKRPILLNVTNSVTNSPLAVLGRGHPLGIERFSVVHDTGAPGELRRGVATRKRYRRLNDRTPSQLEPECRGRLPCCPMNGRSDPPSDAALVIGVSTESFPSKLSLVVKIDSVIRRSMPAANGGTRRWKELEPFWRT